jgi:hypothetical protein
MKYIFFFFFFFLSFFPIHSLMPQVHPYRVRPVKVKLCVTDKALTDCLGILHLNIRGIVHFFIIRGIFLLFAVHLLLLVDPEVIVLDLSRLFLLSFLVWSEGIDSPHHNDETIIKTRQNHHDETMILKSGDEDETMIIKSDDDDETMMIKSDDDNKIMMMRR